VTDVQLLVVGGTKFMGPHVVAGLMQRGHRVAVCHRGRTACALPGGVVEVLADRRDLDEGARRALRGFEPEVVVDMICMGEADARATTDLFAGVARRYVLVSSCDVDRAFGVLNGSEAGPVEPGLIGEDSPLRTKLYPHRGHEGLPPSMADYDKIPAEAVVMEHGALQGTVLRLPMVHGPGDYRCRLAPYVRRCLDGRRTVALDERHARWRCTRGYVENVAHAVVLAAVDERAAGRVFNVAEQDAPSEAEWIGRIAAACGGELAVVPKPRDEANYDQHLVIDSGRIRRELGYVELVEAGAALARTVAWSATVTRDQCPPGVWPDDDEEGRAR